MSKIENSKLKMLIHKLGLEFNLRDDDIRKIVSSPYKFTRETISNLDLDGINNEDDFNKLKTNFIYPYIGKIYTNYKVYEKLNKQKNNLKEKWENKKG
jgi:hypothetical protein